jgi:hypothetical protein
MVQTHNIFFSQQSIHLGVNFLMTPIRMDVALAFSMAASKRADEPQYRLEGLPWKANLACQF